MSNLSREALIVIFIVINTLEITIWYYKEYKLMKSIVALSEKVKNSNPRKHLKIKKANIYEIDNLTEAIENLSEKAADSSSKLSQIIELLNMPIGAFEYGKNDEVVYCTEAFFSVIGVDNFGRDVTYFSKSFFEEILTEIMKNPE